MNNPPKFHGTWKGEVLEAIIVEGMETWQEIQQYTKLSNAAIKQALNELLDLKILEKVGEAKYRVRDSDIIEEYKNHYKRLAPKLAKPPPPKDISSKPQKKSKALSRLLDFSSEKNKDNPNPKNVNLPPPPPPIKYCSTCGVANSSDRNFCGECGEKLPD